MSSLTSADLYRINVGEDTHSVFEVPSYLDGQQKSSTPAFNIFMGDVSASMGGWWNNIVSIWNEKIVPVLRGNTEIYVFDTIVQHKRNEAKLENADFSSRGTDLVEALRKIQHVIADKKDIHIRIFIVTDGAHNATSEDPATIIAKLKPPQSTVVEVFLIGIGNRFPVQYSIDIRSALHNGNSNLPSLFWIKDCNEIADSLGDIADIVQKDCMKCKLSLPGKRCPYLNETSEAYGGEFIYFDKSPEIVKSTLSLYTDENDQIPLSLTIKSASPDILLTHIFRQWNSIAIQQHRNKETVPLEIFNLMETIFRPMISKEHPNPSKKRTIAGRLEMKTIKGYEVDFSTLLNQSKTIIGLESKFKNEIELAELILKTTVTSKHDTKNLKMRGYDAKSYTETVEQFTKLYDELESKIKSLPDPGLGDCCSVTMGSFIMDLKDEDFLLLLEEDRFTVMRTLNMTGIPIYAPIRDSSQINPWSLKIENILVTPYSILSQTVLELSADVDQNLSDDKFVYLQEGKKESCFNAVIPVVSETFSTVLKPLIRSKFYAMMTTFCILKNPLILDMNAHIAALGCAWIKTIHDFPKETRPQFAKDRIKLLETTAKLYLDRKGINTYIEALLSIPSQALMTESTDKFDESNLKCESLVKPIFFLYLIKDDDRVPGKLKKIFTLIVVEFIGRCLSNWATNKKDTLVYSPFFCSNAQHNDVKEVTEKKNDGDIEMSANRVSKKISETVASTGKDLLEKYFNFSQLLREIKSFAAKKFEQESGNLINIKLNMAKVEKLKNVVGAGDLNMKIIQQISGELDLPLTDLEDLFSHESIFSYVFHALLLRSSKDRMASPIKSYSEALHIVQKKVGKEIKRRTKDQYVTNILNEATQRWSEEYLRVHSGVVVTPLPKEKIIHIANSRGIEVSEGTFPKIYKYNESTGLLRNACMIEECPHYLKADRTFNEHISFERKGKFPHSLHRVALDVANSKGDLKQVKRMLMRGKHTGRNKRKQTEIPESAHIDELAAGVESLLDYYKSLR